LLEQLGIGETHLSLSDERELAIAFVTLLRR
jgi:phosphopantetheinyl transferase (holo-ACP synthase)